MNEAPRAPSCGPTSPIPPAQRSLLLQNRGDTARHSAIFRYIIDKQLTQLLFTVYRNELMHSLARTGGERKLKPSCGER